MHLGPQGARATRLPVSTHVVGTIEPAGRVAGAGAEYLREFQDSLDIIPFNQLY
jgi:hypothetical protein